MLHNFCAIIAGVPSFKCFISSTNPFRYKTIQLMLKTKRYELQQIYKHQQVKLIRRLVKKGNFVNIVGIRLCLAYFVVVWKCEC